MSETDNNPEATKPFFEQPQVRVENIPVGQGVPFGIERVSHPELGLGGAYGTWGQGYDNVSLPGFIEALLGRSLDEEEKMDLSPLGFFNRHHIPQLSPQEDLDLEVEVGARLLREAAQACGWKPEEVEGVMIGMSGPVADDYTEQIAKEAGIPEDALKVSVHKACDSSTGALHLALNSELPENNESRWNLAKELVGRKVLLGGIEGLSRFITRSRDINALQLFGNGAGVIGVIPGKTMKFLVGKAREVFDEQGLLAVHMYYPRSRQWAQGNKMIEIIQAGANHIRFAGMMHEPDDDSPVEMAGLMGMVKLFVRNGVAVVSDAYEAYQNLMDELGTPEKSLATTIVHHANYKINKLKWMQLQKAGINISMPWLVSEFGNVSAASNMIAFLRKLSSFKPGDHILFDGFGAGTYYDAFAIALGGLMP
jgi:3-oxoacyl-[acyl-carrier-protein] synthase III